MRDNMPTKKRIDYLTIRGFKSIKDLDSLRLNSLNVLIGGNGVGKSNFVDYVRWKLYPKLILADLGEL